MYSTYCMSGLEIKKIVTGERVSFINHLWTAAVIDDSPFLKTGWPEEEKMKEEETLHRALCSRTTTIFAQFNEHN